MADLLSPGTLGGSRTPRDGLASGKARRLANAIGLSRRGGVGGGGVVFVDRACPAARSFAGAAQQPLAGAAVHPLAGAREHCLAGAREHALAGAGEAQLAGARDAALAGAAETKF